MADVIIIIVLVLMLAFAIIKLYKNKKKGRSSCGGSCSNCPISNTCHKSSEN